jgi:hypothetical protein
MGLELLLGALLAGGAGTEPLKLDVSVDPTIVVPTKSQEPNPAAPHRATVRVTLTNVTSKERRLTFGCPCFLGFEVEAPDGTAAPPEGGGTGCVQAVAEVSLSPGAKETKELVWTARSWDGSFAPLPPGRYKVYGTMGKGICGADQLGHSPMRTPPVTVEVRPAAN